MKLRRIVPALTKPCVAPALSPGFASSSQRLRDLAQYAGEGWDFERPTVMEKVALDGYWSDDVPFEKASTVRELSCGPPTSSEYSNCFPFQGQKFGNHEWGFADGFGGEKRNLSPPPHCEGCLDVHLAVLFSFLRLFPYSKVARYFRGRTRPEVHVGCRPSQYLAVCCSESLRHEDVRSTPQQQGREKGRKIRRFRRCQASRWINTSGYATGVDAPEEVCRAVRGPACFVVEPSHHLGYLVVPFRVT